MSEFTERDSISLMVDYYSKQFNEKDAILLVNLLVKADVEGLVAYAFNRGVERVCEGVASEG